MKILQKDKNISNLSNFKTKAIAAYYYKLSDINKIDDLKAIYEYAEEKKLPVLFVGGGTNMLFAFDYFDGIVIQNDINGWNYNDSTQQLSVSSGESIWEIAEKLEYQYNQNIWHRFIGLPGTIGGAIFGNAGCFGLETENNLSKVLVYNINKQKKEWLTKEECEFSYRNSIFKRTLDYIVVLGEFDLSIIKEKYSSDVDNIYFREYKQPKGNTCGSFFKNPNIEADVFFEKYPEIHVEGLKKISAGFLLEKSGMKGYRYKTAYFSDLHANFLMSDGDGNYEDLLELIDIAKKEVNKNFGVELIPEVRIITNNNND